MTSIQYVEEIRKFNRYYANVLGKIDQEIYNDSFPLTEARVISELHDKKGSTATEIRENLGIDRGFMSRIIQKFEDEKIIIKKQSLDDKRQFLLYLTGHGEEIYTKLVENANREVGNMVLSLSATDLFKLTTAMNLIESLFSKADSSPLEVIIRPFQPGDIGYVAHLHGSLYDRTYKFGQVFEYYVMKGLTEFMLNNDGGELWVAEVNGEIAGSIAITKSSNTLAQLRWFVLDENYQGLGIGKKLMETAIDFSRQQSYQHILLWTVNILETARYLYGKYNFTLTEEKTNAEWTGTELIEERWDLDLSI
jgi:DNA-binding MarR family transcriptional regulator/ribosomal protein S18 acetylase RimI-like enzyme